MVNWATQIRTKDIRDRDIKGQGNLTLEIMLSVGQKITFDFPKLIFWPDAWRNSSRIPTMVLQLSKVALPSNKISSAKRRCERLGPLLDILIGDPGLDGPAYFGILPLISSIIMLYSRYAIPWFHFYFFPPTFLMYGRKRSLVLLCLS